MTGRQLVVWVALFTVMMAVVAVGIAVAVHRQRQKQAQETRMKPLPKAADRLGRD